MDRLPGNTLNELTYRKPEVLDTHQVTIAYQLGMHTTFSYVFGAKDGYQTNYVFDQLTKMLTRIDKESFFELPKNPRETLTDGDTYTQEISACELTNLKYIPSYRDKTKRVKVMLAYETGFKDKYADIKYKKNDILDLVDATRAAWVEIAQVLDMNEYLIETKRIRDNVEALIDQNPQNVYKRLLKAKLEVDSGQYSR